MNNQQRKFLHDFTRSKKVELGFGLGWGALYAIAERINNDAIVTPLAVGGFTYLSSLAVLKAIFVHNQKRYLKVPVMGNILAITATCGYLAYQQTPYTQYRDLESMVARQFNEATELTICQRFTACNTNNRCVQLIVTEKITALGLFHFNATPKFGGQELADASRPAGVPQIDKSGLVERCILN